MNPSTSEHTPREAGQSSKSWTPTPKEIVNYIQLMTDMSDEEKAYTIRAVNCHEELLHLGREVLRIAEEKLLTSEWVKAVKQVIARAETK